MHARLPVLALPDDPNEALSAGRVDLVIQDGGRAGEGRVIEPLARLTYAIYCGPLHPLFSVADPSLAEALTHGFAAPPDDSGHWPLEIPRRVTYRLGQLPLALELCAGGAALAVLPRDLADPRGLRALPSSPTLPAVPLSAVYRVPLTASTPVAAALTVVRRILS